MIGSFFVALAAISVACALVLASGGRRGREAANPWWLAVAGGHLLLTVHVLLLPEATLTPWVAIGLALGGSAAVSVHEVGLWNRGVLSRPGNRELVMESVLIVAGVLTANVLTALLLEVHRVTLIALVLIPLLMVRWAVTRLVPTLTR